MRVGGVRAYINYCICYCKGNCLLHAIDFDFDVIREPNACKQSKNKRNNSNKLLSCRGERSS